MSNAKVVGAMAAALLAAVFLYIALRGVDLRQLGQALAAARPGLVAATCGISTLTLAARAARWRILVNSEGCVPYDTVFWATAAGYFGNNFLPARAGELVRTFLIRSASGLETAYVLATAISERVVDAIVLTLIASVVLLWFPAQSGWLVNAARPFAVVSSIGALVLIVVPLTGTLSQRAIAAAPLPRRVRAWASEAVDSAIRGLRAFHSRRRLSEFAALTAVIWTGDAIAAIVAAAALGLHLSMPLSFLLLSAMGLASAVPSTPGFVGVYQFVAVMVLSPFGFSRAQAISLVIVLQLASYAVTAVWGSVGIARYRRETRGANA